MNKFCSYIATLEKNGKITEPMMDARQEETKD
jgi:hypothetical protein